MKIFNLFANCIPVKGFSNSVICDLQKSKIYKIDNDFFELLTENTNCTLAEVKTKYGTEHSETIENFLEQLIELELGFWAEGGEVFPKLNLHWDTPSIINNVIFEYNRFFEKKVNSLIDSFNLLGVQFLELRSYDSIQIEELEFLIKKFNSTKVRGIYIVLPFIPNIDFEDFLLRHQRVSNLLLFNCKKSEAKEFTLNSRITITSSIIQSNSCCGAVDKSLFRPNIEMFSESTQFNSCLNKKLSICYNGDIKNCPSLERAFGNIKDTKLEDAVQTPEFNSLWNISKDKINKCKDCEFRYVCTDCRAFITEPGDIFSAPIKCNYDPYKGNWGNEG